MSEILNCSNTVVALSNPRSGKNKRGGLEIFAKNVQRYPAITHIVSHHQHETMAALRECREKNIRVIIINGGDGTLQSILTFLNSEENNHYAPELVLLRSGTTSMTFGDVGYKGKLDQVFTAILDYVNRQGSALKKKVRPVLRMNLPDSNVSICGMFFGAGAIHSGILYCRQKIHTRGVRGEIAPAIAMIRFIIDWLTVNKLTTMARAEIEIDRATKVQGDFNIIIATTLSRLVAGVYPYWGKRKHENLFAVSLIKNNASKRMRALIRILKGYSPNVELQENYYHSYFAESVKMEIENGFTLDGELFGEQEMVLHVELQAAGSVTFLAP